LPREVFFGRLGLAGVFSVVWAGDFGRFFPATSGSFRSSPRRTLAELACRGFVVIVAALIKANWSRLYSCSASASYGATQVELAA
jgi:hypothetical protein